MSNELVVDLNINAKEAITVVNVISTAFTEIEKAADRFLKYFESSIKAIEKVEKQLIRIADLIKKNIETIENDGKGLFADLWDWFLDFLTLAGIGIPQIIKNSGKILDKLRGAINWASGGIKKLVGGLASFFDDLLLGFEGAILFVMRNLHTGVAAVFGQITAGAAGVAGTLGLIGAGITFFLSGYGLGRLIGEFTGLDEVIERGWTAFLKWIGALEKEKGELTDIQKERGKTYEQMREMAKQFGINSNGVKGLSKLVYEGKVAYEDLTPAMQAVADKWRIHFDRQKEAAKTLQAAHNASINTAISQEALARSLGASAEEIEKFSAKTIILAGKLGVGAEELQKFGEKNVVLANRLGVTGQELEIFGVQHITMANQLGVSAQELSFFGEKSIKMANQLGVSIQNLDTFGKRNVLLAQQLGVSSQELYTFGEKHMTLAAQLGVSGQELKTFGAVNVLVASQLGVSAQELKTFGEINIMTANQLGVSAQELAIYGESAVALANKLGVSSQELMNYGDTHIRLANQLGVSALELRTFGAENILIASQLGVSARELKTFGEAHIMLANQLGVSARELTIYGESAVDLANKLGVSSQELMNYGDTHIRLANQLGVSALELRTFGAENILIASQLGISAQELKTFGEVHVMLANQLGVSSRELYTFGKTHVTLAQQLGVSSRELANYGAVHILTAQQLGASSQQLKVFGEEHITTANQLGVSARELKIYGESAVDLANKLGVSTRELMIHGDTHIMTANQLGVSSQELRTYGETHVILAGQLGVGSLELKTYGEKHAALASQLGVGARELKTYGEAHITTAGKLGVGSRELKTYGEEHVRMAGKLGVSSKDLKTYGEEHIRTANQLGVGAEELKLYGQEHVLLAKQLGVSSLELETYGKEHVILAKELGVSSKELEDFGKENAELAKALSKPIQDVARMTDEQKDLAKAALEAKKKEEELKEGLHALGKELGVSSEDIDILTDKTGKWYEKMAAAGRMAGAAAKQLEDFGIISSDTAERIQDIGAGISNIGSGIKDFASGNPFKMLAGGIKILSGIGKIFKGLFGDKWKKRAKKALDGLAGVTDDMVEKLKKTAKELKSTEKAMNQLMAEFISEAKLYNEADFSGWANKVVGMMDQLKGKWGTSGSELTGQIGESFEALKEKADKLGLHGSKSMLMLIDKARELKAQGKEIPEVFEYVKEKLTEGATAIETYLSTFADTGAIQEQIAALSAELAEGTLSTEEAAAKQEELVQKQLDLAQATEDVTANWDFIQAATLSTFTALQESGMSFIEVIRQMGGQLADLARMAVDSGLEITGGLQKMTDLAAFIEQNEQLAQRIEATNQIMVALGDTAFLTQEDFTNFAANALSQFDQLIAAGATEEQALMMLGPQLDNLIKYHKNYGYAIDDQTTALIKRAREEGALTNKSLTEGERQIRLQERMVDILERIGEKFGVRIPRAMEEMAAGAERSFGRMHTQTGKWDSGLANVEQRLRKSLPNAVAELDRGYADKMSGHSIVAETGKWKYSLEEVNEILDRDLIDTANNLDKKYSLVMSDINVWTPEETRSIQATPIRRMNLSDSRPAARDGDIVFEHITIQSENGEEAVKEFMTAIKGNKYGVQNLIRKVAH